jgi:hypothetical protein
MAGETVSYTAHLGQIVLVRPQRRLAASNNLAKWLDGRRVGPQPVVRLSREPGPLNRSAALLPVTSAASRGGADARASGLGMTTTTITTTTTPTAGTG